MGRNRFVAPKTVRLHLLDGDWIEIKERLSIGDARQATASFIGSYTKDGARTPNMETLGMGEVLAYLIDWSFRDAQDKPVKVSLAAIKGLDLETYAEIEAAISTHAAALDAADAEREKKIPNGETSSSGISSSPPSSGVVTTN